MPRSRRKLEREHSSALIRLEAREREVARLGAELEASRGEHHGAAAGPGIARRAGTTRGQ